MSTAEFLVFYCPKEPWSPAESYFRAVSIWPSADKKDCILELLICLVIALGISYCLFIPRVFNVTVCSDLVRRCENSSEGILLAQWEDTEQRPPLNVRALCQERWLGSSSTARVLLQVDKTEDETLLSAQPRALKKYSCLCELQEEDCLSINIFFVGQMPDCNCM